MAKTPFLKTKLGLLVERLAFVAVTAIASDLITHINPGKSAFMGLLYVVLKTSYDVLTKDTPTFP